MISIGTNASALMAQAATASVQIDAETAMQRLSSGKRINAAKDDAAGVAIASRMTSHVRGLHQSIRNSMDAQALINTAEGGLQETEALLQRIRELAVQASNDTNSDADRTNLNNEAQQLLAGIDAIASGTTWAGQNLLDGTYSNKSFQVGGGSMAADQVTTSLQSSTAIELGLGATTSTSVVTTTTQEPTTTYSTNDVDTPVAYTELAVRNTSENTPSTRYVSTDYLENGNVISVWETSNANNSGTTLKANISDSSNSSVTAEFEIISSSQGSNTTPSVKALRNGGFIVTWNEQLEGGVNGLVSTIKARIFDSVGNATTGDLLISDGVNGINLTNSNRNYRNPSVIELNNGNLVIGFEGVIDLRAGDNNWGVGAKIITSTGTSVKDQFKIHSATNNGQHDLKLAALSTGGFSAAYKSSATYSSWQVIARVFSADGQPTTSETAIHSGAQRFVYGSAPADNGNTIFLYKFNGELMAKKYNAQMVAQSLETAVMSSFQNNGSITKMDDGTYIVVGANSLGYFAQRLNDDLSKVGEILSINNSAPTNGMIEISANSQTEFTGIWTSNENSFDIVQQFFSTEETTSTTTYETVTTTETVTSTMAGIDLTSGDLSREALTRLDTALQTINSQRAELGSLSNRLDHIIANNTNASTNAKASLGRIQDADFAAETTKLAKSKILEQSSTAMLAQANASVYEVLTLIPD